jgi:hypothetical protein
MSYTDYRFSNASKTFGWKSSSFKTTTEMDVQNTNNVRQRGNCTSEARSLEMYLYIIVHWITEKVKVITSPSRVSLHTMTDVDSMLKAIVSNKELGMFYREFLIRHYNNEVSV